MATTENSSLAAAEAAAWPFRFAFLINQKAERREKSREKKREKIAEIREMVRSQKGGMVEKRVGP